MLSPLHNKSAKSKTLSENDYAWLKHNFIMTYGYELWKEITLKEFWELLPEMNKEIAKRENLRLSTLKYYGVKNPK